MFAKVTGVRIPHTTKNNNVISKLPILVENKKAFIYCNIPVGDGVIALDDFEIGQIICVDLDNGYYRLSDDQSPAQGKGSQVQMVQHAVNGTIVNEKKEIDGNDLLKATKLLANCINGMRAELPKEFSTEDCRTAGISLFIYLTKHT